MWPGGPELTVSQTDITAAPTAAKGDSAAGHVAPSAGCPQLAVLPCWDSSTPAILCRQLLSCVYLPQAPTVTCSRGPAGTVPPVTGGWRHCQRKARAMLLCRQHT